MTLSQDSPRISQWQFVLDTLTNLSYRSHNLDSYLHTITCSVSHVLQSDWSIVTLHAGENGQVIASNRSMAGLETGFSVHESISGRVVQAGQPVLIPDVQQCPEAVNLGGYRCYLGVPLRTIEGKVIGTICSFSDRPQYYDAATIQSIELFAERAATAIDNYQLYQQQQQFNDRLEAEIAKRTQELRLAQDKLIEHERLAAIGEFTAMIVHEIRNPLTTVQMGLTYFTKLDLPSAAQMRLSLAIDEADRLANLLQEVLNYSKPQILQLAEIDLHELVEALLVPLRSMPEAAGRRIEYLPYHSRIQIRGDVDKLKQVFINLVRNACEAVMPGEPIRWSIGVISLEQVCISVHNGGPPIPPEVLPKLTMPFFSTKAEGTGLGLAIVERIIKAHRGELRIDSSQAQGTTFSVRLPLHALQPSLCSQLTGVR